MFVRVLVTGLSGVLHPADESIDPQKPMRWLSLLDEILQPWKDVRIVVTSSHAHTPSDPELPLLLGPLAPRLWGYTFQNLPEEDAIAASVRLANRQLEHLVLVANDFDLSRQSLNHFKCDPKLGLSSDATQQRLSAWLTISWPGYCD